MTARGWGAATAMGWPPQPPPSPVARGGRQVGDVGWAFHFAIWASMLSRLGPSLFFVFYTILFTSLVLYFK